MFLLIMNVLGTRKGSELSAELGSVLRDVQLILGVSKEGLLVKLKGFSFIQMIKFSETENNITVPDIDKAKNFLLFLQGKKDKKTRLTSAFDNLQDDTKKMQCFERLYQLLTWRKGEVVQK